MQFKIETVLTFDSVNPDILYREIEEQISRAELSFISDNGPDNIVLKFFGFVFFNFSK